VNLVDPVSLTLRDGNPIPDGRKISSAVAVEPQLASHASAYFTVFGVEPISAALLERNSSGGVALFAIRFKRALKELAPAE
jgi:hypothetical protein